MSTRLNITWSDGAYKVNKAMWAGGEVIPAEEFDALQAQRDQLLSAAKDALPEMEHRLESFGEGHPRQEAMEMKVDKLRTAIAAAESTVEVAK